MKLARIVKIINLLNPLKIMISPLIKKLIMIISNYNQNLMSLLRKKFINSTLKVKELLNILKDIIDF